MRCSIVSLSSTKRFSAYLLFDASSRASRRIRSRARDKVRYSSPFSRRVTVNKHNGSLKIIVAHEEPGRPNWIETAGHQQGTMCFRWIRAV